MNITRRYMRYGLAILTFITLLPMTSQAQDVDTRTRELERQLEERDLVILELLERVENLERRVGVERIQAGADRAPVDVQEPEMTADAGKKTAASSKAEPGAVVVGEGEAERALERSLVRAGALLLPPGVLEIEPGFYYARQENSITSLVMTEDQILASETELNSDRITADMELRLGLPWDSQFEIGLPYQWREVESINRVDFTPAKTAGQSGAALGDIRLGFAKTLLREGLWSPDLVGRITWDTSSGEPEENGVPLGGGFNELRGSLTAIKRQDPLALVGGLYYQYSFEDGQIQPGQTIAANFGTFIALSPETSMRFLFAGAYQDTTRLDGDDLDGSDQVLGTFVVGGTTLLAKGLLLNLAVNIGLTDDADDFGISISLPYRFDNPLF